MCISLLAALVSCAKKPAREVEPLLSKNELDDTLRQAENFVTVEFNESYELSVKGATTEIALKDKGTGAVWYSNPQDRDSDPIAEPNNIKKLGAQIEINYGNDSGQVGSMNNFTDSVDLGQFEYAKIDGGLRVTYVIGKKTRVYALPKVITEKHFKEKVLDKLSEEDREYLLQRYTLYTRDDDRIDLPREDMMKKYPRLSEDNVYQITEALAGFVMERLEEIVAPTGYTAAEVSVDNEYNGQPAGEQEITFTVSLEYTIDENGLCARVRTTHIQMPDGYKITSLDLLSFFGAGGLNDRGYMFVPDGCGALIDFNNGKQGKPLYKNKVYGEDLVSLDWINLENNEQIYLPVYGIKNGNNAFVAVIEEAEAISSVNARVSRTLNGYNYVYPSFEITQSRMMHVPYYRANERYVMQESDFDRDLVVRYLPCVNENADYTGMARRYQQYMADKNALPQNADTTAPFFLELLGGIEYNDSIAGVPVTSLKALTTFSEAETIIKDLKSSGIDNIITRYRGWSNHGMNNSVYDSVEVLSQLGGKNGLKALGSFMKTNGYSMYMDVNIQSLTIDTKFDSYNEVDDSPRDLLGQTEWKTARQLATGERYLWSGLIAPRLYGKYAGNVVKDFKSLGLEGVSLADMGKELYSDFNRKEAANRQKASEYAAQTYKSLADAGIKTMSAAPNAYAIAGLTGVSHLPDASSRFYITDRDVPFYQIFLSGRTPYAFKPFNLAGDFKELLLKSAESGAAPCFLGMFAQNKELYRIDTRVHTANYTSWIKEAEEAYRQYARLSLITAGSAITSHRELEPGVFETGYKNGAVIYVNYNNTVYDADIHIDARSFAVKGE